jgi:hypothetical protein
MQPILSSYDFLSLMSVFSPLSSVRKTPLRLCFPLGWGSKFRLHNRLSSGTFESTTGSRLVQGHRYSNKHATQCPYINSSQTTAGWTWPSFEQWSITAARRRCILALKYHHSYVIIDFSQRALIWNCMSVLNWYGGRPAFTALFNGSLIFPYHTIFCFLFLQLYHKTTTSHSVNSSD